jgi:hypothetical protein
MAQGAARGRGGSKRRCNGGGSSTDRLIERQSRAHARALQTPQ